VYGNAREERTPPRSSTRCTANYGLFFLIVWRDLLLDEHYQTAWSQNTGDFFQEKLIVSHLEKEMVN